MARAQRAPNTRARDIDFSNVGRAGRRTGLTLPQQKVDEYGLEEVSQLFSSPKKPSPLKQMHTAEDLALDGEESTAMTGIDSSGLTPAQALSTRRTARASLPRSASPRKTGIRGNARRSTAGFRANQANIENEEEDAEDEEEDADDEAPVSSPSRANRSARRLSSAARDGSPLRDITTRNQPTPPTRSSAAKRANVMTSIENEYQGSDLEDEDPQPFVEDAPVEIDDYDRELEAADEEMEVDGASAEPMVQVDDEEADETFNAREENARTAANSRRKRKSDDEPARRPAKRAKKRLTTVKNASRKTKAKQAAETDNDEAESMPPPRGRGRPPLKSKDNNVKMTKRQEKELDEVVERVKARPNPPRSLYVLRKETPSDANAHLTRSGRMTVKPLAYWRNERCVWGGSPNTELKEGIRFPMNSIKEIIRSDEHNSPLPKKPKRKAKGKGKQKARSTEPDSSSDDNEDTATTEPWELGSGTIRGLVSEWDSFEGLPLNVEQEIEIAHSSQAIQTYVPQPKNGQEPAQFRYSKLFSNSFMSVGLVDLPPGGIKKPKNSQKMQMTFYVLKGRVTVCVGPVLGETTTFGIGKGGFWQVPRGNQYSIENECGSEARLLFCQGCMVSPEEEE